MVANIGKVESDVCWENGKLPTPKSYPLKSKTTEISIPDVDHPCHRKKCKRFEKQLSHVGGIIHHVQNAKSDTFTSKLFLLKTVGLIILFCDIFYLNLYLSRTESALQLTLRKIEKLETELSYSRLTSKILRADLNFARNANKKIVHNILSTLSSLIKNNEAHTDHAHSSDKHIFDELFVKRDDNVIKHFVSNSIDRDFDVDSELLVFNSENLKLPPEKGEDDSTKVLKRYNYADIDDDVSKYVDKFYEVGSDNEDGLDIDGRKQLFSNETIESASAVSEDRMRTRREALTERRGPLAVTLRGIHPEAIIEDGGLIAPWITDRNGAGDYHFKDFVFREGNGKIEVTAKGLYLIYAQVFYLSSNHLNGFSINMQKSDVEKDFEISKCSVDISSKRTSEVSCYTSAVRQLLPGDKIYLIQRERNSRILHGDGHTYFGLVALNNPPKC